jgi:hypothetical protein
MLTTVCALLRMSAEERKSAKMLVVAQHQEFCAMIFGTKAV